ncbi:MULTISPECIES: phosphoenolpyruvate--protein phosphotransferase [Bradyrhizobium]|jgi:phosphoenolpyruvate-protein phosphotransferase (PTS system enzyme I)|uniref:phosphoenolpyruvate--protein phosphotransferase n=1 Tax=Bradyrhizobium TaxID=374 RepID=UPI000372E421|nr:phosphoenolpyruvate--protein phosphotransferase [Bradyrhizobium elkanii]QOZ18359.1 phosphoenolpyruvate--protein phosphotransferase [Bradyrhizobium sp. CCBAU 21365]UQD85580.1 phosphoenolpyruvate--protein phosphotransferase [Bradyrhizobium elkanii USDA 76]BBB99165.1 phosphoenolpyruvate-protein phosphotransferase [Bradyrhizobium elkanii USDA 61]MBP2434809.1 phosphotransferase system enzyme I (PtsI) [Bradyrhizobium elkanii]MCS3567289.1 phosphotransferase system enzyme I (PtsI) [Bradyrhizobium e
MQGGAAGLAYRGRTASIGFAHGPFVRVDAGAAGERVAGTLVEEALALRNAIDVASGQIADLAASAGGEAAQILEFQVALLEDEDLIEAVFASIGEGRPADIAWRSTLDAQIADYNSAPDDYLKARSSDLADLRDRVVHILRGDQGQPLKVPSGGVVCADDLPPSRFLEIDWSGGGGLALLRGSPTSHVAMLARARGIPMVVQLGTIPDIGTTALLDGEGATLELDPNAEQVRTFEKRRDSHLKSRASARAILRRPTASWRGERIKLFINIQRVEDLEHADAQYADGIGLMRTEFLLAGRSVPDEETQFQAYDAVLRWAGQRPVTIRTFDAGGDKPVPGFTLDGEANPFLGVRGLRLCLARPEIFAVQLRALARAAIRGNLKVMFPMVTSADELEAGRKLFADIVQRLLADGIAAMLPELGIMVEVPAAALAVSSFKAAFFSIGSNDLAQYVLACDRSNGALAPLMDPLHPAVLELIARTAEHGRRAGISVSLCGDMAGDPRCLPALLNCGLRELSVNASALAQIKHTIDRLSSGGSVG